MKKIFAITLIVLSVLYAKPCMIDIYTGNGIMTKDEPPSEAESNMIVLREYMLHNSFNQLDPQKMIQSISLNTSTTPLMDSEMIFWKHFTV